MGIDKRQGIPLKVRAAIAYLIEEKNDLKAAADHAGIHIHELRRSLGQGHIQRYARDQKRIAIEAFCLGSPAALAKVRDTSENGIAIVNAVKAGEMLRDGALHEEASSQKRIPGLQIVIVTDGKSEIAYAPQPMIDIAPAPEAVPATRPDAEAE
jgi:uncharacterized protein YecA (UPF0149 family)